MHRAAAKTPARKAAHGAQVHHRAQTRLRCLQPRDGSVRTQGAEAEDAGQDVRGDARRLDRAEAKRVLESGEFIPAFNADVEQARAYGISGVPFFVIDGKYGVSGAQNPDVFVNAFNQILEERN